MEEEKEKAEEERRRRLCSQRFCISHIKITIQKLFYIYTLGSVDLLQTQLYTTVFRNFQLEELFQVGLLVSYGC